MYQQGDVLLTPCTAVPLAAKALPHKKLAEGEATGHAHVAEAPDVRLFEVDGVLYMSAPTGTTIKHQEHNPITVPPGTYKRGIVQEYDHFAEEARDVAD